MFIINYFIGLDARECSRAHLVVRLVTLIPPDSRAIIYSGGYIYGMRPGFSQYTLFIGFMNIKANDVFTAFVVYWNCNNVAH